MRPLKMVKRYWVGLLLFGILLATYYLSSTTKIVKDGQDRIQDLVMFQTGPIKPTLLTHAEISQRFQQRRNILQQACEKYHNSTMFHHTNPRKRFMDAHWPTLNKSLLYCPIEKAGSTTWNHILGETSKQIRNKHSDYAKIVKSSADDAEVKFLFVREPYARLLSAYVDKLFCPNSLFWKIKGQYIIKKFRPNPSEVSLRCGHDVTFLEFVRYVVDSQKTVENRNGHFIPTHDHCDVCHVDYDYIGHLETLSEDMPFLFHTIQLPKEQMPKSFDNYTILNNAGWVLNRMKAKVQLCMSMYEACLRLWKKWHIRGIISKKEPLPVTPEEAETISMDDFVQLALKALERSTNKEERKRQKTEALREAFASVPLEDRLQVQEMLTLDFALFGFDPKLEAVFPNVSTGDDTYSYFDLIQEAGIKT